MSSCEAGLAVFQTMQLSTGLPTQAEMNLLKCMTTLIRLVWSRTRRVLQTRRVTGLMDFWTRRWVWRRVTGAGMRLTANPAMHEDIRTPVSAINEALNELYVEEEDY